MNVMDGKWSYIKMVVLHARCNVHYSATLQLNVNLEDQINFIILLKINTLNPIFNVHYILQYHHLDVRLDLVHNIHYRVFKKSLCT